MALKPSVRVLLALSLKDTTHDTLTAILPTIQSCVAQAQGTSRPQANGCQSPNSWCWCEFLLHASIRNSVYHQDNSLHQFGVQVTSFHWLLITWRWLWWWCKWSRLRSGHHYIFPQTQIYSSCMLLQSFQSSDFLSPLFSVLFLTMLWHSLWLRWLQLWSALWGTFLFVSLWTTLIMINMILSNITVALTENWFFLNNNNIKCGFLLLVWCMNSRCSKPVILTWSIILF